MRRFLPIPFVGVLCCLLSACGPSIYLSPRDAGLVAAHRRIAILPPRVDIIGNPRSNPDALMAAARADADDFHQEIFSWLLQRQRQGKLRELTILDPATTDARLRAAGLDLYARLNDPQRMLAVLGVDAVLETHFTTSRPMSEAAAIAQAVLIGAPGSTKRTVVAMGLHDPTGGLVWNYEWVASGSFVSASRLVNALMRNASKRLPYAASP